ncbi:MAG: hypothetical protein Q8R00_03445 [Candidatus Nanoarchaeia archaeon]|nr:hypothetical protein [Candidatus Nanoarchaeia archaeon]
MAKEGRRASWFSKLPEKAKDVERLKILSEEGQHWRNVSYILRKYRKDGKVENFLTYDSFREVYLNLRLSGEYNADIARRLLWEIELPQFVKKGLEDMYWAALYTKKSDYDEEVWISEVEEMVKTIESKL